MTHWFAIALWKRILGALLLGALFGFAAGEWALGLAWIGELFIRFMRMMVIPLVLALVVSGVASLGSTQALGRIGTRTILLLVAMTTSGICVGLWLGTLLEPGAGMTLAADLAARDEPASIGRQLMAIVPVNPFQALAAGDMLAIVVFALFAGVGVLLAGDRARPAAVLADAVAQAMLRAVSLFMELAPLGCFSLIAAAIASNGLAVFSSLSLLAIGLVAGVLFQIFVVQAGVVRFGAGMSLRRFFAGIVPAVLFAFSTTSSAATLPVSLRVAIERLKLDVSAVSASIPMGASIARDGTGVYVGLLCAFSAQAFGVTLGPADYAVLVLGSALLSFGAAGVPSAALFMLSGVLSLIGLGEAQAAAVAALILPFDRLLDMIRTVPNVTANLAVATVVAPADAAQDSPPSVMEPDNA